MGQQYDPFWYITEGTVTVRGTSKPMGFTSVADPECLSRIPDLDFFYPYRIAEPGVKKAPDPGSGTPGFYLEYHLSLVESSLPGRALLAGNGVLPQHQVHRPVRVLHRPRDKPEQSLRNILLRTNCVNSGVQYRGSGMI
jgi:hypothetical protein